MDTKDEVYKLVTIVSLALALYSITESPTGKELALYFFLLTVVVFVGYCGYTFYKKIKK